MLPIVVCTELHWEPRPRNHCSHILAATQKISTSELDGRTTTLTTAQNTTAPPSGSGSPVPEALP